MKLERLAGNIGYVDFRAFMPPSIAGDTASAAMNFLAACDAVIFDMRQNGGGDPAMVAFITTYLFGPQPVQQGQTVRLRLASADNQGPLRVGVDNVRLEPIAR